jgi:hypothetical protein
MAFLRARLAVVAWRENLSLYPPPARYLFDRHLQFVTLLAPTAREL